jgi:hypothetical protein
MLHLEDDTSFAHYSNKPFPLKNNSTCGNEFTLDITIRDLLMHVILKVLEYLNKSVLSSFQEMNMNNA